MLLLYKYGQPTRQDFDNKKPLVYETVLFAFN